MGLTRLESTIAGYAEDIANDHNSYPKKQQSDPCPALLMGTQRRSNSSDKQPQQTQFKMNVIRCYADASFGNLCQLN